MKLHVLKIEEGYLMDILYEGKTFELRKNDRGYEVGDLIHFIDTNGDEFKGFHGNLVYRITYILKDVPQFGLDNDYCILAIKLLKEDD